MKRALAALCLVLFAAGASAAVEPYNAFGATRVDEPQECPAGTNNISPNYDWQDGHLVRNGWVCQQINSR